MDKVQKTIVIIALLLLLFAGFSITIKDIVKD